MLRRLYEWTLSLSARDSAESWLAGVAFVESSFFLIPADALFLPMVLARPERAFRYALVATLASTAGGVAGYLVSAFAFEAFAEPVLELYGRLDDFERLSACASDDTVALLLITSGLTHLPPIKLATLLAGALQSGLVFFIFTCILARGARFFALGWALRRFGESIKAFIAKRLGLIAGLAALVLILIYLALKAWSAAGGLGSCS